MKTEGMGSKHLTDWLDEIVDCATLESAWDTFCAAVSEFGFDRLIYGFTRFAREDHVGELEDVLFLTNHDPDYFKTFIMSGKFQDAPVSRWARENGSGSVSWGSLWRNPEDLTEEEKEIIDFNRKYDVRAGYSMAIKTLSRRSRAMIVLAARRGLTQDDADRIWAQRGRDIELLGKTFHLRAANLPIETSRAKLTARQMEILEMVAEGQSNQVVANRLSISVQGVEKHLRSARVKLGVDTTIQAIAKMTFLNRMYIRTDKETEHFVSEASN